MGNMQSGFTVKVGSTYNNHCALQVNIDQYMSKVHARAKYFWVGA
jgi:hypothetical protein